MLLKIILKTISNTLTGIIATPGQNQPGDNNIKEVTDI